MFSRTFFKTEILRLKAHGILKALSLLNFAVILDGAKTKNKINK